MKELFSKNYILFTVGSFVSVLGSHIAWFAMGILIFKETQSILQFAIYFMITSLPQMIIPLLASPHIDRFSRKKTIILFDYLFGALFFCFYWYLTQGLFQYALVVGFSLLINTMESVYSLAFYGLFPDVTPKSQMQRASAILGGLPFLADAIGLPVAAWLNTTIGVTVLMLVNCISYLITATMELFIQVEEKLNTEVSEKHPIQQYLTDLKEGWGYVRGDTALWGLVLVYFVSVFGEAFETVAVLPFFISSEGLNETMYANAAGLTGFARVVGTLVLLVVVIPKKQRHNLFVLVIACSMIFGNFILSVSYMWYIIFEVGCVCFGLISYTLRMAAVSEYVAPEKRGRFYAIFNGLITLGLVLGYLAIGVVSEHMSIYQSYIMLHSVALIVCLLLLMKYRKPWKQLFGTG